jgi:hypothetical protein
LLIFPTPTCSFLPPTMRALVCWILRTK